MRKVLGILLLCLFANNAIGQEVANCKSPKGKAYYFNMGIVPATKAGWDDDKISGGAFTLTKQGNDFDVLYFDVTKKITSSRASGAVVQPLRIGEKNFTLMVYYANDTIELYTFAIENSGAKTMHLIQSKGGESPIQKSSVLIAECATINFELLK